MKTQIRTTLAGLLIALILTACQVADAATPISPSAGSAGQAAQSQAISASPTATAIPTAVPTATAEPTAVSVSSTAAAEQAAQAYFAALQAGDFAAASKLVSAFSLTANKLTAGDVATTLTEQKQTGAVWSALQIVGSQVFDDHTTLVHVTYQLATTDAKTGKTLQTAVDEQWPFRLENKQWLYNWTNIIDFKTLSSQTKLVNGLAVTPLQLTRYADKIRLTVLTQNTLNEAIVIGQTNQTLATFTFGSQSVTGVNTRYVFDTHRSYTDVNFDVAGLFTSYPDTVELVKYPNYTSTPAWFTFNLAD
jgi:hypothetical protein